MFERERERENLITAGSASLLLFLPLVPPLSHSSSRSPISPLTFSWCSSEFCSTEHRTFDVNRNPSSDPITVITSQLSARPPACHHPLHLHGCPTPHRGYVPGNNEHQPRTLVLRGRISAQLLGCHLPGLCAHHPGRHPHDPGAALPPDTRGVTAEQPGVHALRLGTAGCGVGVLLQPLTGVSAVLLLHQSATVLRGLHGPGHGGLLLQQPPEHPYERQGALRSPGPQRLLPQSLHRLHEPQYGRDVADVSLRQSGSPRSAGRCCCRICTTSKHRWESSVWIIFCLPENDTFSFEVKFQQQNSVQSLKQNNKKLTTNTDRK